MCLRVRVRGQQDCVTTSHPAMGCLSVLIFLFLWSKLVNTKVVNDFYECNGFFYKAKPPSGFEGSNYWKICQTSVDAGREHVHFASLYDKASRIPTFSAYTLKTNSRGNFKIQKEWFIEPQLFDSNRNGKMEEENSITDNNDIARLRESQAVNEDYKNSVYDRGHLFPNSYLESQYRLNTFTLTNAVPMDACFNRVTWMMAEKVIKVFLFTDCLQNGGIPYLLTGAVPNQNRDISYSELESAEVPPRVQPIRVSVPSHAWTAACCDHHEADKKFSFAVLGENRAESKVEFQSVQELTAMFDVLYGANRDYRIFEDDCGRDENKKVKEKLIQYQRKHQVAEPTADRDAKRRKIMTDNLIQTAASDQVDVKAVQGHNDAVKFQTVSQWARYFDRGLDFFCVLAVVTPTFNHDELRRRRDASQSSGPVCVMEEKFSSRHTAKGEDCVGDPCGYKGESYSWCKTAGSWDYCCTGKCEFNVQEEQYKCNSQGHEPLPCAPLYSRLTVKGTPCRSDHPCGTHGEPYYWCYTDSNWEYCCAPKHPCGIDGEKWCWVEDNKGKYEYCNL